MSFLEKSSKPSFRVVWGFFFFFLIQLNSKCKQAYFNIWYRWVVNADNSWRMSDQGVLALYQEDDFVLGMQNNTHYSSLFTLNPSQWRIPKLQVQAHDPQWNGQTWAAPTATFTNQVGQHSYWNTMPHTAAKSSAQSPRLHLSQSGPSECYFRHCLPASQAVTVPFECSSTLGTFFYMFSTSVGTYSTVLLKC